MQPMDLDYQLLFRSIPGLYLVLTPDLVMVESSDARLHATMTRREEILGRHVFEVFTDDPDDPAATGVQNLRASLERVLQTRQPDVMAIQKYSLRRPGTDGGDFEERYWSPVNVPVLGPDGEIRYIIHRVEDITELLRAVRDMPPREAGGACGPESLPGAADPVTGTVFRQAREIQETNRQLRAANAALALAHDQARATERRTREILDSIGDAFYAIDEQWHLTYVNRVVEEMWGQPREALLGRGLLDVFPELRGTEFEEHVTSVVRDRVSVAYETRSRTGLGLWLHVRIFPTEHGVTIYAKDITSRRRATDAVRLLAEAGRVLSESLDLDATLHAAAHLIAPSVADVCVIDVLDANGEIRRAVRLHADADEAARLDSAETRGGVGDEAPHPIAGQVIRSGRPLLIRDVSDPSIASLAQGVRDDGRHASSALRSLIVVPLLARERIVGAMKLGITQGARRFDDQDLALAEELARRIGIALDNAALYRQARDANASVRRQSVALAAAHARVEDAQRHAVDILESITDAFFALDRDFRFTYVNRRAEERWLRRREDLLGRIIWDALGDIVGPDIRDRLTTAMVDRQSCEFEAQSPALGHWLLVHANPSSDGLAVYSRDITEHKMAEQAREHSEAIVRLLGSVAVAANEAPTTAAALQSAVSAVCTTLHWTVGHAFRVDGSTARVLAPTNCWHLPGLRHDDVFRGATEALPPGGDDWLPGRVLAAKRPMWMEDVTEDPGFRRAEAARRVGLKSGIAIPVLVGSDVRAVLEFFSVDRRPEDPAVLDALAQVGTQLGRVIEREESTAARLQLLERVVLAQEEERRRISRELHDQLGQHLTALVLGVQALRSVCEDSQDTREHLDRLEELAERVGDEARDLAMALRPTLLDDFGLASAIRAHVERWSSDTRIPVILEASGFEDQRLPSPVETAAYRIVLEALTNVARHAGASRVNIILETAGASMHAIVEDDGGGFEVDAARGAGRLGLVSMSERAALVGGTLIVESSPGAGTTVMARFPLSDAAPAGRDRRSATPA
jgi:PAS domain S-box-containing protein